MYIGGTQKGEYLRSIELFEKIFKEQGAYHALAFLYDSQYQRTDIGNMLHLIQKEENYITKKRMIEKLEELTGKDVGDFGGLENWLDHSETECPQLVLQIKERLNKSGKIFVDKD